MSRHFVECCHGHWPPILIEATGKAHLEQITTQIKDGLRGDIDQWLAAEKRWETVGIVEADFYDNDENNWFDANIAKRGLPAFTVSYARIRSPNVPLAKRLVEISKGIKNKRMAETIAEMGAALLLFGSQREEWPESDVDFVLDTAIDAKMNYAHGTGELLMAVPTALRNSPPIATKIGLVLSRSQEFEIEHPYVRDLVVSSFDANPTIEALWYPASLALVADETTEGSKKLTAVLPYMESQREKLGIYPKIALSVLRLIGCTDADVNRCVDDILAINQNSPLLSALLAGETLPVEKRLNILNLIIKKLHQRNSPYWTEYIPLARKALDTRKSDLTKLCNLEWQTKVSRGKLRSPAASRYGKGLSGPFGGSDGARSAEASIPASRAPPYYPSRPLRW